jgi:hypothetical protein
VAKRAKDRPVNPKTGAPVSKLSILVELMRSERWDEALALAASFPRLGDHDAVIRRGHEAVVRADFQRQIGKDPAALRAAGIEALKVRYADALKGGA